MKKKMKKHINDDNELRPCWSCDECGYETTEISMPKDRDVYYKHVEFHGSRRKCPRCKSEGFHPKGW